MIAHKSWSVISKTSLKIFPDLISQRTSGPDPFSSTSQTLETARNGHSISGLLANPIGAPRQHRSVHRRWRGCRGTSSVGFGKEVVKSPLQDTAQQSRLQHGRFRFEKSAVQNIDGMPDERRLLSRTGCVHPACIQLSFPAALRDILRAVVDPRPAPQSVETRGRR
jgi:hypothetical protein